MLVFISLCIPLLALAQEDNNAVLANQYLKSEILRRQVNFITIYTILTIQLIIIKAY